MGRQAYAINNKVSIGANLSYDASFDTLFSADIKWRFNTNGGPGKEQQPKTNAAVKALTATPNERDVRVHDDLSDSDPNQCLPDVIQIFESTPCVNFAD